MFTSRTEETNGIVSTANRTPVETFYNLIFEDLKIAVANLPVTQPQYGKVTKGAAQAFLARMYLTRGMNKEALEMAQAVLANTNYKLEANYADLWKMSNLKTKEAIYVVDYSQPTWPSMIWPIRPSIPTVTAGVATTRTCCS